MPNYHTTAEGDIPFTAEEEAEWDAKIAGWNAGANDRKAAEVRKKRNAKIAVYDLCFLTDRPADASLKAYRQALRDIPQQPGFPDNVDWPVEP